MIFYEDRKKQIGQRIKQEREIKGLSKPDLLEKICMSPNSHKTVSAWERGDILPSLDNLAQMAELFNCDIGYLLCDYDEHNRDSADVCAVTGLSEKAVDNIIEMDKVLDGISGADIISDLLEQDDLGRLVNYLHMAYTVIENKRTVEHSAWDIPDGNIRFDTDTGGNPVVILWPKETARIYMREAVDIAKEIIEEALRTKWNDTKEEKR